jgi:hypothetical protein
LRCICIAVAFAAVACGPFGGAPAPPRAAGTASAPPARAAAPGPAAVVLGLAAPSSYTITLVFADGHLVGPVRAQLRTVQPLVRAAPAGIPVFSASGSRVYYLDGDNDVRFLALDGSRGTAGRVAGGTRAQSGFAVSPDDRRLAVATIDYSQAPAALSLSVEDVGGGGHVDLLASTGPYEWPVGWHDGQLVVAMGSAATQNVVGNPYGTFSGYQLIDAATGARLAAIQCAPAGALTPAGTACIGSSGPPEIEDFAGRSHSVDGGGTPLVALSAAEAPDGARVAFCCAAGQLELWDVTTGTLTALGTDGGRPFGWIDATHLLVEGAGSSRIVDVASGAATPVQVDGQVVGRVPGGL